MCKNVRKGKFFCDFIEIAQFDEAAFMGVFESPNYHDNGDRCLAGRMAMHTRQIGPSDTALPCPGSPQQACVETKEEPSW